MVFRTAVNSNDLYNGILNFQLTIWYIPYNNHTRVLFFFYYEGKIVLTNGFIKKRQKTPPKEIKLAKERRADFKERMRKS